MSFGANICSPLLGPPGSSVAGSQGMRTRPLADAVKKLSKVLHSLPLPWLSAQTRSSLLPGRLARPHFPASLTARKATTLSSRWWPVMEVDVPLPRPTEGAPPPNALPPLEPTMTQRQPCKWQPCPTGGQSNLGGIDQSGLEKVLSMCLMSLLSLGFQDTTTSASILALPPVAMQH